MLPARRHEIARLEAFSDAVFAFALTLLFVVRFYVYPLKFPFTAAFSFFMLVLGIRLQSSPDQIANIFAIYGAGFIVLFGMFALLYRHAHTTRDELRLDAMELFDLRASGGAHGVSMAVGARATGVAAIAPPQLAVFSGVISFLMGPAHWVYVRVQRRRLALEARLVDTPSEAEA
ncbi:MAG: hypothetical protein ACRD15_21965 [Vicinamibacterales bacterium]